MPYNLQPGQTLTFIESSIFDDRSDLKLTDDDLLELQVLVSCYAKSNQENLTADEAKAAKDYIERQRNALKE